MKVDQPSLAARLEAARGFENPTASASVAAVISTAGEPSLLLLTRASNPRDPWSGHVSFPGGRYEPGDAGPLDTSIRETDEEVSLQLSPDQYVGDLGALDATHVTGRELIVFANVFVLTENDPLLEPNEEVVAYSWVPVSDLTDPALRGTFKHESGLEFPAVSITTLTPMLWGMTLRFVDDLLGRL